MPRNNQSNRGGGNRTPSKNNNPEGYNQYNSGWTDTARERPFATAAAAAAAVGASVFLWSRRNQITEQLSNLSDQIGEWGENLSSRGGSEEYEMAGTESSFGASSNSGSGSSFSGGLPGSATSGSPTSGMPGGSDLSSTTGSSPSSSGATRGGLSGTGKSGRTTS